jgi:acetyl esterase/lipase
MELYRAMYLPNSSNALNWDASPNLAPAELLAKSPSTWVAVAGQDLVAPEAVLFSEQLERAWETEGVTGRDATVKVYEGATHSTLAMAGMYT